MHVELVEPSGVGRSYSTQKTVSISDVTPSGRVRFDAIARLLADVGNDDTDDAGLGPSGLSWVARRCTMQVNTFARTRERLTFTTWCSGIGRRWAERRTSIVGSRGASIEAAALWVHIDPETAKPTPWDGQFASSYLQATADRQVDSRLKMPKTPPFLSVEEASAAGVQMNEMPWSFRRSDLDVLDHINNAAYLSILEEAFGPHDPPSPMRVSIEWQKPTNCDHSHRVLETFSEAGMTMWLLDENNKVCVTIGGGPVSTS